MPKFPGIAINQSLKRQRAGICANPAFFANSHALALGAQIVASTAEIHDNIRLPEKMGTFGAARTNFWGGA